MEIKVQELPNGDAYFTMDSSIELDPIDVEFAKLEYYMKYYIRCLAMYHFDDWNNAGITVSPHTGITIHDDMRLLFGMDKALTFEQFKKLFIGEKEETKNQ